jgi:hypothetical protein
MATHDLRYETLIEDALRTVVQRVLRHVAEYGLPGGRGLYLTYRTRAEGVEIPDRLLAKYPEEITIVLEHQFWDLEVEEGRFAVTLSFNRQPERLVVPFAALTRFADPGAHFGIQFKAPGEGGAAAAKPTPGEAVPDLPAAEAGNVVAIDAFRKR